MLVSMNEPARSLGCRGETWEVNLPILGGWTRVVLRGYVDGATRTKARLMDDARRGVGSNGLVVPGEQGKAKGKSAREVGAEEKAVSGSWSLRGIWEVETIYKHGAPMPWGGIVDNGEATWRRPSM